MKRCVYLLILMAINSSAHAGQAFSFVVGGHRISIEAPRHCRSTSCVSVSIPGIYETHSKRDNDGDADTPARAPAPVAEPVLPRPVAPPARPPAETVAPAPPAVVAQAAPATAPTPATPKSDIEPPAPRLAAASVRLLPKTQPEILVAAPRPTPEPVSRILEASHGGALLGGVLHDPEETPVGDWQTEGNKGSVRIEPCGPALCGYVLNRSSGAKGETVLINMKPKAASVWSGDIYSLVSGDIFYATMALRGPNSLKVEACALGKFFCSGNAWSRIEVKPAKLISYRQAVAEPRS
jgi:hypothetical protein